MAAAIRRGCAWGRVIDVRRVIHHKMGRDYRVVVGAVAHLIPLVAWCHRRGQYAKRHGCWYRRVAHDRSGVIPLAIVVQVVQTQHAYVLVPSGVPDRRNTRLHLSAISQSVCQVKPGVAHHVTVKNRSVRHLNCNHRRYRQLKVAY